MKLKKKDLSSVDIEKMSSISLMCPRKLQTPICSLYKIVEWFEHIRESWDILSGLM